MGFENRFYSQAENELNEIVIKNRRIHENREKEIYEKYSDISSINNALISTSGKLLTLIADKNGDISARLRELESENISLQAELKSSLKKHGFPEDYLEPVYSCHICNDKGTVNGKRCECFMNMVRKAAAADLNLLRSGVFVEEVVPFPIARKDGEGGQQALLRLLLPYYGKSLGIRDDELG